MQTKKSSRSSLTNFVKRNVVLEGYNHMVGSYEYAKNFIFIDLRIHPRCRKQAVMMVVNSIFTFD